MFIAIQQTKIYRSNGRSLPAKFCVLSCDSCKLSFKRKYKKIILSKPYHFCSRKCLSNASKKGGIIDLVKKQTNLDNYGVPYPGKLEKFKQRARQTCLRKYGVSHPSKTEEFQRKRKGTNLNKYGVEHLLQIPKVRKDIKTACQMQFGVENHMQRKEVKQKLQQTLLEKYGVKNPSQVPCFQEKKKQTSLKNWGTEHPQQSPIIRERVVRTCLEKYGAESFLSTTTINEMRNSPEINKKRHETMKRNKTYGKSKIEDLHFAFLKKNFGS